MVKKTNDDTLFLELLLVLFTFTGIILTTILLLNPINLNGDLDGETQTNFKSSNSFVEYDESIYGKNANLNNPKVTDEEISKSEETLSSIGSFYRTVLMVGGNSEIIKECYDSDIDFDTCIEARVESDSTLKSEFEKNTKEIESTIGIAESYGIDYMSVPFIRDLLGK